MESTCYNIFTKKKRNPSDGFTSNICKSSATHAWGSFSNHVVKSSRLWRYCRWVKSYRKLWVVVLNQIFIYQSLLKVILLQLSYLIYSAQGKRCSTEVYVCHKQHAILLLSWWTGLLESIHCNQGNDQIIWRGHCKTDYIDSNLPDDSWIGWRCSWRPIFWPFGCMGIKIMK